jgi:hypothetical protein
MEKRDFCIDFLKGNCDQKINCKFAHIIVPDPETFAKTYDSRKMLLKNDDGTTTEKKWTLMGTGTLNEKWMTSCDDCNKGFFFSSSIEKGTIESLVCSNCLKKKHEKSYQ